MFNLDRFVHIPPLPRLPLSLWNPLFVFVNNTHSRLPTNSNWVDKIVTGWLSIVSFGSEEMFPVLWEARIEGTEDLTVSLGPFDTTWRLIWPPCDMVRPCVVSCRSISWKYVENAHHRLKDQISRPYLIHQSAMSASLTVYSQWHAIGVCIFQFCRNMTCKWKLAGKAKVSAILSQCRLLWQLPTNDMPLVPSPKTVLVQRPPWIFNVETGLDLGWYGLSSRNAFRCFKFAVLR